MSNREAGSVERLLAVVARTASGVSARTAMTLLGIAFAAFVYGVARAPAFVSFVLSVTAAIAWCVWLDAGSS